MCISTVSFFVAVVENTAIHILNFSKVIQKYEGYCLVVLATQQACEIFLQFFTFTLKQMIKKETCIIDNLSVTY